MRSKSHAPATIRLCANTDPQRDSLFTKGPSDVLDHSIHVEQSCAITLRVKGQMFRQDFSLRLERVF